jgi:hypothetical protein
MVCEHGTLNRQNRGFLKIHDPHSRQPAMLERKQACGWLRSIKAHKGKLAEVSTWGRGHEGLSLANQPLKSDPTGKRPPLKPVRDS